MLRIPAQFWCLLHLNPVTMKSVPLLMWRTAVLMFAPAPMARIVCALLLQIMQQPVLGRVSWSSGEILASAVSEMLLKPAYFTCLEGISWQCQIRNLEWDYFCKVPNISYGKWWDSTPFLHSSKDAKTVHRDCWALGERNSHLTYLSRTFDWISIFSCI